MACSRRSLATDVILASPTCNSFVTRREVEVLAIVGEGCSDAESAERLFIGKMTALVQLENIKDKLATENRVETPLVAVRTADPPTGGTPLISPGQERRSRTATRSRQRADW